MLTVYSFYKEAMRSMIDQKNLKIHQIDLCSSSIDDNGQMRDDAAAMVSLLGGIAIDCREIPFSKGGGDATTAPLFATLA